MGLTNVSQPNMPSKSGGGALSAFANVMSLANQAANLASSATKLSPGGASTATPESNMTLNAGTAKPDPTLQLNNRSPYLGGFNKSY